MKRSTFIRRTRLRRNRQWQPKRRPLPPKSAKRIAEDEIRRGARAEYLALQQWCEMCGRPWGPYNQPEIHERLSRARGGSITNPNNFVALCHEDHALITREPAWAEAEGWALKTGVQQ